MNRGAVRGFPFSYLLNDSCKYMYKHTNQFLQLKRLTLLCFWMAGYFGIRAVIHSIQANNAICSIFTCTNLRKSKLEYLHLTENVLTVHYSMETCQSLTKLSFIEHTPSLKSEKIYSDKPFCQMLCVGAYNLCFQSKKYNAVQTCESQKTLIKTKWHMFICSKRRWGLFESKQNQQYPATMWLSWTLPDLPTFN